MIQQMANPLKDLHDIHLPSPVSFWPPAPGWYLVALIVLISLFVFSKKSYPRLRRFRARKQALKQLKQLQNQLTLDVNAADIVAGISTLLRRVALLAFSRKQTARLAGREWLQFLDQHGKTKRFTQGAGQLLISAAFQKSLPSNDQERIQELFLISHKWIRRCL